MQPDDAAKSTHKAEKSSSQRPAILSWRATQFRSKAWTNQHDDTRRLNDGLATFKTNAPDGYSVLKLGPNKPRSKNDRSIKAKKADPHEAVVAGGDVLKTWQFKSYDDRVEEKHSECNSAHTSVSTPASLSTDLTVSTSSVSTPRSNNPSRVVSNTLFDCFCHLSKPLTPEEQNLLAKYLYFIPAVANGNHASGPFDPVRDISWPSAQVYPERLQWMLADAEHLLLKSQGLPDSPQLLQRRATGYRKLGQLFKDPTSQISDLILDLVVSATLADSRSDDPEITRRHLRGICSLIQRRGGYSSLFSSVTFMHHPMFAIRYLTLAELEVSDLDDGQSCAKTFSSTLKLLQRWAQTETGTTWGLLHQYQHTVDPALKLIMLPPLHPMSPDPPMRLASRFVSLYLLNLVLWDYNSQSRTQPDFTTSAFLDRLSELLSSCGAISLQDGHKTMKIEGMCSVIAKAWSDVENRSTGDTAVARQREVYITEVAVDGLKVFHRLKRESRDRLVGVLAGWLFGNGVERIELFSGKELQSIEDEAGSLWYEEQKKQIIG